VSHVRDLGFHSGNEDAGLPENDVISVGRITDLRWSLPSPSSMPRWLNIVAPEMPFYYISTIFYPTNVGLCFHFMW
jgi:hypothetical protein